MRIVDRVRLDTGTRKEESRYPMVFVLGEGDATEREVSAVARVFKTLCLRVVENGVDDYLHTNVVHNPQGIFLARPLRNITRIQRDWIIEQMNLYQWAIEETVTLGREPDSKHSQRYDYYFARQILDAPLETQPEWFTNIEIDSAEFESRLTIKNDDHEIEELVSALGY